jgi:hypothetical protein
MCGRSFARLDICLYTRSRKSVSEVTVTVTVYINEAFGEYPLAASILQFPSDLPILVLGNVTRLKTTEKSAIFVSVSVSHM